MAGPQLNGLRRSRTLTHGPEQDRRECADPRPRGATMGSSPEFTAHAESRNGIARIELKGELDIATVPVLKDHLAQYQQNGVRAIMVDFRELEFIDSSGLHALLEARALADSNGHELILVGVGEPALSLFALTKTEFLMNEEKAVPALDQFTSSRGRGAARAAPEDGETGA